jgi:hypothetical protein
MFRNSANEGLEFLPPYSGLNGLGRIFEYGSCSIDFYERFNSDKIIFMPTLFLNVSILVPAMTRKLLTGNIRVPQVGRTYLFFSVHIFSFTGTLRVNTVRSSGHHYRCFLPDLHYFASA